MSPTISLSNVLPYQMRCALSITLLFIITLNSRTYGQTIEEDSLKWLSPKEMASDLDALVDIIEEAHPFLYYFNSKFGWRDIVNKTKLKVQDSLTQFEFYRLVSPVIVSIHEGHTYIAPSSKQVKFHQLRTPILPLKLFFVESHLYVDSSFTESILLPRGTEITHINGTGVEDIITDLESKANFSTGTEAPFMRTILSSGFNFSMGYSYYIEDVDIFDITFRLPGSDINSNAKITGIINPEPERIFPYWCDIVDPFQLKYFTDSIAYLKVQGWMSYDPLDISNQDIKRFFKESFASISEKNVGNLIIDLRDNGGGNPRRATELLRYLVPTTFKPIEYSELTTQELNSIQDISEKENYRISKSSLKCDEGKLIVRQMGLYKKHKPRKHQFNGNIYFIVNAKCASATSLFLALAEHHDLGVFIGENPSGNREYICGHQLLKFNLPNSGFRVQIPLRKSKINTTNNQNKHGVTVDHKIRNNLDDILAKRDTQLEFTLRLIENR